MENKIIVGMKEQISILELDLFDLDAKVDTGADSNSLHCDDIYVDDKNNVHFKLLDEVHPSYHGKEIIIPLHMYKKVKSSNGHVQVRPTIKVTLKFFGKNYNSIITLTNRADMKLPMLLGRRFLKNRFLVDVSQEYLCNKEI